VGAGQNSNNVELPREFKVPLGTSIFALTSGIVFGSFFFYYFLFPVQTDFPWRELSRLLMLGISLWIYYEVLFSSLKLKLTESGIETTSFLSNRDINWAEIEKVQVTENYFDLPPRTSPPSKLDLGPLTCPDRHHHHRLSEP